MNVGNCSVCVENCSGNDDNCSVLVENCSVNDDNCSVCDENCSVNDENCSNLLKKNTLMRDKLTHLERKIIGRQALVAVAPSFWAKTPAISNSQSPNWQVAFENWKCSPVGRDAGEAEMTLPARHNPVCPPVGRERLAGFAARGCKAPVPIKLGSTDYGGCPTVSAMNQIGHRQQPIWPS